MKVTRPQFVQSGAAAFTVTFAAPEFLNDLARALLFVGGDRRKIYNGIRLLLRDAHFEPSPALMQIAQIVDFDLFISTTFDGLLALAMEKVRPGFARSRDYWPMTPSP